ncbi:hypothetical protein [Streptomyces sp. B1I3]|uniref:hypothetical protein n=1 Tax=Streptomyces sp. B1I3 TaxID=3042264 RepID=UPI00278362BD|nr:hypothetical protein [Streptomyces sp. B1I3]
MQATVLNGVLRVAVEEWAWRTHTRQESVTRTIAHALRIAQAGLPDRVMPRGTRPCDVSGWAKRR